MSATTTMPEPTESLDAPVVAVDDLSVSFEVEVDGGIEERLALSGVSLHIERGEFVVLVGKSGCGKTTLLNALAGLVEPTAGSALVDGARVKAARDQIGYMFARDALLPWRTARRNVEFALELRQPGLKRAERRDCAQRFLELVGLGGSAKLYPWQLSQGMRQRVALARTWAIDPQVLLMDEPFAALDAQTRTQTQESFLDLWSSSRRTVVFVTHDLTEAILMADRVIVMSDGHAIDEVAIDIDRPRDAEMIVEHPSFRELHHQLAAGLKSTP